MTVAGLAAPSLFVKMPLTEFFFLNFFYFCFRNVAVVKSNKDTRYGIDSIVTHDGLKMPCWALPDLSSFAMKVGNEEYQKVLVLCFFMVGCFVG